MPPKKADSKSVAKKCELQTLCGSYGAACRKLGILPYKPFTKLAGELLESSKPLDRVLLQDPDIGGAQLRALVDAMAGYPGVRTLCLWGCSIGDDGLEALAQFLQASCRPGWRGSSLAWVEVSNDGNQLHPTKWGQRYMDMVEGRSGLVTQGQGFAMPSLLFDPTSALSDQAAFHAAPVRQASSAGASWLCRPPINTIMACAHLNPSIAGTPCLADSRPMLDTVDPQAGRPRQPAFSAAALRRLARALGTQGLPVTTLVLDHCNIGDAGVAVLSEGLMRCRNLTRLSLAYCCIGEAGASSLAATLRPAASKYMLEQQPQYAAINLQGNPLTDAGLARVAEAAAVCSSLRSLDVADTGVSSADRTGLPLLAQALVQNTQLELLDVSGNNIGDWGAMLFLEALEGGAIQHVRQLRLSPAIDPAIAAAITSLLLERSVKSKKGSKGGATLAPSQPSSGPEALKPSASIKPRLSEPRLSETAAEHAAPVPEASAELPAGRAQSFMAQRVLSMAAARSGSFAAAPERVSSFLAQRQESIAELDEMRSTLGTE